MDYFRTSGFVLLLCFLSLLQGFITITIGQSCSCASYDCDFTNHCVPEGNCRKENVALGKAANISSLYHRDGVRSGPACLAVNGNTDTTIIYASSFGNPNCVKSSYDDYYPSWTVDLEKNYTITNITLYTEKSYINVVGGLQITVDGILCYQYPNTASSKEREDIQCTEPITGRNVKFYSTRNFYIFFCEVQVWACRDGYYGQNCSFSCGNCFGGVCDKTNGSCPNGCEAGWMNTTCEEECHAGNYGPNCKNTCGDCVNGSICNKTTGVCPYGCNNGWPTPYCNQTCVNGTYGSNCSKTCGKCANGDPCDKENGMCLLCMPGWILPLCQQACNIGTFGQNCSSVCGNCMNDETCDKVNGNCISCEPGMIPPLCLEACNNGTYGLHCSYVCGNCTKSEPCHKINGACLSCEPGLIVPLCQQACSNGTYGQNCSGLCGNCTNGEPCNKVDGQCLSCDPGLKPPLCRQACTNGTYGQNCSGLCGNCTNGEACDKVDGKCRSCAPGLVYPLCKLDSATSKESGNNVGPIVGAIVGGFIILSISLSVTIMIYLRRYKSKSADSINTTSNVLQPVSDTRASIQPSKKDESGTEYDEIGNPYDSLHPADDSENHNYASHFTEEKKSKSKEDKPFYVNVITKDNF